MASLVAFHSYINQTIVAHRDPFLCNSIDRIMVTNILPGHVISTLFTTERLVAPSVSFPGDDTLSRITGTTFVTSMSSSRKQFISP